MLFFIMMAIGCVSPEDVAARDALFEEFVKECRVNAKAVQAELLASNTRLKHLVSRRRDLEQKTWIGRRYWTCADGYSYVNFSDPGRR